MKSLLGLPSINFNCHSPHRGVWIEIDTITLHSGVLSVTPPTGECGLKLVHRRCAANDNPGHSPHRGVWIEISTILVSFLVIKVTPPSGEFGLKFRCTAYAYESYRHSPLRGVWIEIDRKFEFVGTASGHSPLRGVWIEIASCQRIVLLLPWSLPPQGSVD